MKPAPAGTSGRASLKQRQYFRKRWKNLSNPTGKTPSGSAWPYRRTSGNLQSVSGKGVICWMNIWRKRYLCYELVIQLRKKINRWSRENKRNNSYIRRAVKDDRTKDNHDDGAGGTGDGRVSQILMWCASSKKKRSKWHDGRGQYEEVDPEKVVCYSFWRKNRQMVRKIQDICKSTQGKEPGLNWSLWEKIFIR